MPSSRVQWSSFVEKNRLEKKMKPIRIAVLLLLPIAFSNIVRADDWPQWLGPKRDGIWKEEGIIEKFPQGGPKVLWRAKIGSGYAGPAVSNGRVFLMDRVLSAGAKAGGRPGKRGVIPGKERVSCLNESDGKLIWQHEYDSEYTVSYPAGPRATPTVDGDRVYTLGAEGNLFCLSAKDGSVQWQKDFKKEYGVKTPVWGFAAAPLVYRDMVICLVRGDGSTVIAYNKKTGMEVWRALSAKEPGYCPPTLIEHGGKEQLVIWHPEAMNSLDPTTGKIFWSIPWKLRSGLSIPTPRLHGDYLFFTAFYNGSTMLKLKSNQSAPEVIWQTEKESEKRTTHLNSIISTPYLVGNHIYGVCSYGEFRCLEQETGKRVWESFEPGRKARWSNVFLTPNKDRWFLFNESGDLIIAKLSPEGYEEIDRAHIIEANGSDLRQRSIVWTHPAYANGNCYVRNDSEIICISLKKE